MEVIKFTSGFMDNNSYLVRGEKSDKAVVIDVPYYSFQKVKNYCEKEGIEVVAVLLTHGHFDHIGDLSLFQKDGAKVYIHRDDVEKLSNPEKSLIGRLGNQIEVIPDHIFSGEEEKLSLCGVEFIVMHTPGHSKGSVCYLVEKECIFTGDTIFAGVFGRTDFYDGSMDEMIASAKKIFAINGDLTIYPGHNENGTLEQERNSNEIKYYL